MKTKTIKIYGTDSSRQKLVESLIKKHLNAAGLSYNIQKVKDISTFIDLKLESIPSIQLGDGKIYPLKEGNFFQRNLRKALSEIMSYENFGSLKKIIVPIDFSNASINAFMYAHRLATKMDAITKVLHIDTPLGSNQTKFHDFIEQVDTDWNTDILKASLISSEYYQGPVKDTLISTIKNTEPEFIVLGNSYQTPNNVYDDTVNAILNRTHTNILLIPPKAKYNTLKKIVYPYIEIGQIESHLDFLVKLAKPFLSEITLLNLNTSKSLETSFLTDHWIKKYDNIKHLDVNSLLQNEKQPTVLSSGIIALDDQIKNSKNEFHAFEQKNQFIRSSDNKIKSQVILLLGF